MVRKYRMVRDSTFINSIIHLLEQMDQWAADPRISKDDFLKDMRTQILLLLKDGMVYPYMTFYGLEESTVFYCEGEKQSPEAGQRERRQQQQDKEGEEEGMEEEEEEEEEEDVDMQQQQQATIATSLLHRETYVPTLYLV
jgi:TATA-binding protein-associated factor Taf7